MDYVSVPPKNLRTIPPPLKTIPTNADLAFASINKPLVLFAIVPQSTTSPPIRQIRYWQTVRSEPPHRTMLFQILAPHTIQKRNMPCRKPSRLLQLYFLLPLHSLPSLCTANRLLYTRPAPKTPCTATSFAIFTSTKLRDECQEKSCQTFEDRGLSLK